MRRNHILILFLIMVSIESSVAQLGIRGEITPVIGWDSLKSLVQYPEIFKRAGVQGYAEVEVQYDTSGNSTNVIVVSNELFRASIVEAIKKVKWNPEVFESKRLAGSICFEIQFQLRPLESMPKRKVLIIETDYLRPHIEY